jgi:HPt (histidine-containing phosphotransfer) domain-containing protein
MYDLRPLKALAESLDEGELTALVRTFHASLVSVQREMGTLPAAELRARVHRLASSAWALGIDELASAAADLDRALAGPSDAAYPALRAFELAVNAAVRDIDPVALVEAAYSR